MSSYPTLGTFFSGCECVGVGFLAAGFRLVWHCEWDKRPSAVLRYRFPDTPNYGDVATFPAEIAQFPDVVWMSPPCQDLSIIGGKAGLDGEKSKYFFDAVRVIHVLRSRGWKGILIMEQVPAILSSTGGKPAPMARILQELRKLGPLDLGWRVFNGRYCGVPQSRRRVFIVLDFGGFRIHEILCDTRPGPLHTAKGRVSRLDDSRADAYPALATQPPRDTGNPDSLALVARSPERYARPETIVPCLMTREPYRSNRKPGSVVPCLLTQAGTSATVRGYWPEEQNTALRWRTPLEHERLMGLPDDWTRYGIDEKGREIELSDAARYHMTGNGVIAPIAEHLALNIRELIA